MTVLALVDMETTLSPTAEGRDPDVLTRITDPVVQLAIWSRPRPPILDWIDGLEWDAIDDIDAPITGPDFLPAITRLLCDAGYPQTAQGETLASEVEGQAIRFAQIMDCLDLRLRLEVIETDACRKFHMDYVRARLLMTLAGEATQWIEVVAQPDAPVHQLAVGDVAIFKGRLDAEEPAILHRSPPIAGTQRRRLLLALDPVSEPRMPIDRVSSGTSLRRRPRDRGLRSRTDLTVDHG